MAEAPPWGLHRDAGGIRAFAPLEDGRVGLLVSEPEVRRGEPGLDDLRAALAAAAGTDYGVHSPTSLSRFTDAARQAASYRAGRVLLAGDAAHVHAPVGGLGLNIGVQDAVNPGWKLAQVVASTSPEGLLDTYHAERHPVAAAAMRATMARMALLRGDERTGALRGIVADLLAMEEPRRRLAAMLSGLDVRYEAGGPHPLAGRRVPDLDLETPAGPARVFSLLHDARPALLDLGLPGGLEAAAPWAGRVRRVSARYEGAWERPVIGPVSPPRAVLIRPDGHAAWAGEDSAAGLAGALGTWFGPPAPAAGGS